MIALKSAAAFYPSGSVLSLLPPLSITSPRLSWGHSAESPFLARHYASLQSDASRDAARVRWPVTPNPTPYEIFDQAKTAPYNKVRFFQLAKMYHPDLHHASADGIPHLTKLERYRLVVAANEILSNPEKRGMYDRYGMGWEAPADLRSRCRSADKAWRQEPGNASTNATWEDWERWRQERDGVRQEPVFVSNGTFVVVIALLALMGGWGHLSRAETHSKHLLEMRDQKHAATSSEARRRQNQTAGLSRQGRVEHFLQQRHGWGYDRGLPPEAKRTEKRGAERTTDSRRV